MLVGVSGGPDSSALLLILDSLRERRGLTLVAAHFDHRLRGEKAAADELRAVRALAGPRGIEVVSGGADVRALAKSRKLTLEEAARRARYDFLATLAQERGIAAVAVGHTADDQAETVVMHILRGAGLTGVAGMSPQSRWPSAGHVGLSLVRPLLALRREDTEAYCRAAGITPLEDESNRSAAFLRNRVRAQLMPALREYNPAVRAALTRLADAARLDLGALDEIAAAAVDASEGVVRLDRSALRSMPEGVRRHAVRLAFLRLLGDLQGVGERHVMAVEAVAVGVGGGGRLDLPRGVTAKVGRQAVELAAATFPGPSSREGEGSGISEVRLAVPGEAMFGGLRVAAGAQALEGALEAVTADVGAVGAGLIIRCWRAGDRMQPLGMTGTKKLQDLFVDAHLPREERGSIPVSENGRGIVWVGGLRLAEWARPRNGQPTLVLSYRRER